MDLLPLADQADHGAPLWNACSELNKVLGLRLGVFLAVLLGDLVTVPGALRFVEYQNVLGWNPVVLPRVALDVVAHVTDEDLPITSRAAQLVLQDLDQRTVTGEEHRWGSWLAIRPLHSEVVEVMRMNRAQADKRLTRAGDSGQQNEPAGPRARGL